MGMSQVLFYIVAIAVLAFAFLSVTSLRIMRAAVYLLFALIGTAALYFLLNMELLAVTQIAVYVGGVVVLILFAIVLTHEMDHLLEKPQPTQVFASAALSLAGIISSLYLLLNYNFAPAALSQQTIFVKETLTVENIGVKMLDLGANGYILPFEVISVLLLAAMIGSIVMAMKEKS